MTNVAIQFLRYLFGKEPRFTLWDGCDVVTFSSRSFRRAMQRRRYYRSIGFR